MSMPTDINISVKEYNKISKYNDLEIEIEKKCDTLNYRHACFRGMPRYNKKREKYTH